MRYCKKRVCKEKTLFGQPNRYSVSELLRSQTGQRYPSFRREYYINFLKLYKVKDCKLQSKYYAIIFAV